MMRDDFTSLASEFNETARKFPDDANVTTKLLLAKYTALLNFKAETDADKTELAATLFDCGVRALTKAAAQPMYGTNYTPGEVTYPETRKSDLREIFSRLAAPDSIGALPRRAPGELADAALALLRKAEALTAQQLVSRDKTSYNAGLTALAELALDYAAKFAGPLSPPDVSTSQSISASKPIIFKKEGPEATP